MRSVSPNPKPVHSNIVDLRRVRARRMADDLIRSCAQVVRNERWHLRHVDGARLTEAPATVEEVRHG